MSLTAHVPNNNDGYDGDRADGGDDNDDEDDGDADGDSDGESKGSNGDDGIRMR